MKRDGPTLGSCANRTGVMISVYSKFLVSKANGLRREAHERWSFWDNTRRHMIYGSPEGPSRNVLKSDDFMVGKL